VNGVETSAVGDELAAHCLQVPLATNFSVRDVDKKLLRELGVEVSKAFLRRHLLIVLVAVCLRPLPHNPLLSRVEGLELAFLKEEMAMLLLCQRKQKKKVEERRRKKRASQRDDGARQCGSQGHYERAQR